MHNFKELCKRVQSLKEYKFLLWQKRYRPELLFFVLTQVGFSLFIIWRTSRTKESICFLGLAIMT